MDHSSAVGVRMCLTELIRGETGIALEQERLDLIAPGQVDDFLVRQNGLCGQKVGDKQDDRGPKADANAGSRCSKATKEQKHDDH